MGARIECSGVNAVPGPFNAFPSAPMIGDIIVSASDKPPIGLYSSIPTGTQKSEPSPTVKSMTT